ncbi:MAG: S9 family peptidase [Bacteroidales bacterium]|jgi:oligopeptidase B|nr:S9 family peptidase [Bacteroidales bacterium]
MKNLLSFSFLIVTLLMISSCADNKSKMNPPVANKINKELTAHNDTRIDPYYWLNDRENPEVISYLEEENNYTEAMMKHTEELQTELYDEIVGRIKQTDMSVPYKRNGYFYYSRYEEGMEYPIYCRKEGTLEADEEIMLNVNEMAEGYSYFQVGGISVSHDNKLIAYGVDTLSRRKYTIHFKDLETGEILADAILNTTGYAPWASDNKTVFYTRKDEVTLRPEKIFRHKLGDDASKDPLIYFEEDETFRTGISLSKSMEYLMIGSFSTLSSEYRILKADDPEGEFSIFQERQPELEYYISHYQDRFYIRTNHEAKNFRLMETPARRTALKNWKEVIPHREDVLLEDYEVFNKYLALQERKNGLTEIRVLSHDAKKDFYIEFDEQAYVVYLSTNLDFDTELLRYGYTSMTIPNSVYDYNMNTGQKELLKRQEVVGGYDPDLYYAERLFATAADGVKVPISLVYKKDLKKEGGNPLVLYGYGSYGASMDPYFSSTRLSLLDRGFVYAIAHIRGGEEMGRQWYEDGKLLKKKNTFTDFISCGEFLIEKGYTTPDNIYAMGGSAGGLLVGAVYNMRPDLFKGVIAAVPFVDVVTTMLDESIPLTTGEYDEWGNPNVKEYYDYMLSYSPYDNVEAKDYPAMLVTTGLHDSQVQYWEPAKWVAKLRDMKTDDNLLLLWTNMDYGHGGASGRFQRYKEVALEYAFLIDLAGVDY